ncbi:DedA family protein [Bythopirellula polymerisocia]|uniref:Inner membrane protein YohD n=1 Tax=Bythopirellula polymerisocia TaxID=2528003 RepID=A0A5C6CYG3_9BACT|nr:DedA family protein [Bythopirellula polymerisocia]TWU28577.1 Inner membrane protein YohD [Bythopirellula polymerisocia]
MDILIESGGYVGIVVFLLLTGCGLPIPEEVPIVLAGIISSQGNLNPVLALLAAIVGALLGDTAMYAIGYHFGHGLVMRHPKLSKWLGAQREEYFEQSIQRHMFKVMLLARFMVGVRGPVYLSAGVARVPFRKFILYDLICATLVVGTFFTLAYYFGNDIVELIRDAEVGFTLVVLLAILIAFLWWLRRQRQQVLDEVLVRHASKNDPVERTSEEKSLN